MAKATQAAPAAPAPAPTVTTQATSAPTQPGRTAEPPRETIVMDWDPQKLGEGVHWEAEGGTNETGDRGKEGTEIDTTDDDVIVDPPTVRQPRVVEAGGREAAGREEADAEGDGTDAGQAAAKTAPPDKDRAAKRAALLEALGKEKGLRGVEAQARAERTAREAAETRASQAEARLAAAAKGDLSAKLAFLGLTREELADEIIMNGGSAAPAGDRRAPAPSKDIEELRAELAALKAERQTEKQTTEQAEVNRKVQASRDAVSEMIKDEPVPLVRALKAHDRIISGAWNAWNLRGKAGNVSDYVPAAAEIIEEELRAENPELAKLVDARAGDAADAADEPPARAPARRPPPAAVGRRTGAARSGTPPARLSLDPDERTFQIIHEEGWQSRR